MADVAAERNRRIGVLSVVIVLVIVCAFWTILVPHTKRYRAYKSETKVREKLQTIKPPAGARLVNIRTSHEAGWPMAESIYSTDLDCEKVKKYYREEFSRQGFNFRDEDRNSRSEVKFVFFSTPGYEGGLSCFQPDEHPLEYMIILNWTSSRE